SRTLSSFPTRRSSDLAGRSLAEHNVVLGITYYGLFRTSLTIFGILGVLMLIAIIFPVWLRDAVHWLATRAEHKSARVAARIEQRSEEHTSELQSRFDL